MKSVKRSIGFCAVGLFYVIIQVQAAVFEIDRKTIVWENHEKKLMIVKPMSIDDGVFKNVQQCYECEFSPITQSKMDIHGNYNQQEIRSHWACRWDAYIFYIDNASAGLCVINYGSMIHDVMKNNSAVHDVAEFFIMPNFRKRGFGEDFATAIFMMYKGRWEVRQLPELVHTARIFWRKTISKLADNKFVEIANHPNWLGLVQIFELT